MRVKVQNKKNYVRTNPKGPKRLWVPKYKIFFSTYILQGRRKEEVMVHGQWLITTYDKKMA